VIGTTKPFVSGALRTFALAVIWTPSSLRPSQEIARLTVQLNSCTAGGGMLQTWQGTSSRMLMSFSYPQLMAYMRIQARPLLELDAPLMSVAGQEMWIAGA
jgi:hypothetical protein